MRARQMLAAKLSALFFNEYLIMSRVAKYPVVIPVGVSVELTDEAITIKGGKGVLTMPIHEGVEILQEDSSLKFAAKNSAKTSKMMAGTTRALVNNMVIGVHVGFERKLELVGVGYRAKANGATLNMTLGFSHPIDYEMPTGVAVETPTQTEVILKGTNKQLLGQVAAEIRAFRQPEPYKGKGVRYANESVHRKEAKKK